MWALSGECQSLDVCGHKKAFVLGAVAMGCDIASRNAGPIQLDDLNTLLKLKGKVGIFIHVRLLPDLVCSLKCPPLNQIAEERWSV